MHLYNILGTTGKDLKDIVTFAKQKTFFPFFPFTRDKPCVTLLECHVLLTPRDVVSPDVKLKMMMAHATQPISELIWNTPHLIPNLHISDIRGFWSEETCWSAFKYDRYSDTLHWCPSILFIRTENWEDVVTHLEFEVRGQKLRIERKADEYLQEWESKYFYAIPTAKMFGLPKRPDGEFLGMMMECIVFASKPVKFCSYAAFYKPFTVEKDRVNYMWI